MDTTQQQHVIEIYRKRAANYDFTANLYYLFGYREWAFRREAVAALSLKPGDTVIEIACGTGLNFSLYQDAIGPDGRIIGVDLTDAMLEQARLRVAKHNWQNVELVHSDALDYVFPDGVDAVISTYALSLVPDAQQVLAQATNALASGGRLALLELQIPDKWPEWFSWLAIWLMRPFAVTDEWADRHPWESIKQAMNELLADVHTTKRYLGLTYIIAGRKT